ncbi:glutathione synthase [Francisellaceae bacterium]|nr:glutathione synthase [Francisellaceae bacterium]
MKTLFIIDPIQNLAFYKDSSIMMMQAAQKKRWPVFYATLDDLSVLNGNASVLATQVEIHSTEQNDCTLYHQEKLPLEDFKIIFMRKEPPFDLEYIYGTYALELAEKKGSIVVNKPQALRDANEKFFITHFPEFTPPTLITRSKKDVQAFLDEHKDIILKPLDGMGGASIFRVKDNDPNFHVIFETLTKHEQNFAMIQRFMPEISDGDKRVILINGEAIPYCLARLAAKGENRANLAAGGRGEVRKLTQVELNIAEKIGPTLKAMGIYFVGIDVIGNKITEINVTCPTCLREIYDETGVDAALLLMNSLDPNTKK